MLKDHGDARCEGEGKVRPGETIEERRDRLFGSTAFCRSESVRRGVRDAREFAGRLGVDTEAFRFSGLKLDASGFSTDSVLDGAKGGGFSGVRSACEGGRRSSSPFESKGAASARLFLTSVSEEIGGCEGVLNVGTVSIEANCFGLETSAAFVDCPKIAPPKTFGPDPKTFGALPKAEEPDAFPKIEGADDELIIWLKTDCPAEADGAANKPVIVNELKRDVLDIEVAYQPQTWKQ